MLICNDCSPITPLLDILVFILVVGQLVAQFFVAHTKINGMTSKSDNESGQAHADDDDTANFAQP